jgi:hypothetical protein
MTAFFLERWNNQGAVRAFLRPCITTRASIVALVGVKPTEMVSNHIHARKVSAGLGVDDDRARIVSMRDAIAQSKSAINQSLVAIASTRKAIAFLDRLSTRTLPDSPKKQR